MLKNISKIIWNIFVTILVLIAIIGDVNMVNASQKEIIKPQKITQEFLPTYSKQGFAVAKGNSWTPTFQLCWNEFINLVDRNNTIEFVDGNPPLADELNKQKFTKEDLNENSYYIKVGKMTLNLKKEIEKGIWDKFKEKSDILNSFKFENVADNETNKYFIYSMLLKNFPFKTAFTDIEPKYFGADKTTKYKFFGLDSARRIKSEQLRQLGNIFYANDNDFAFKLYNEDNSEEMIFYMTDSTASFDEIYYEMLDKAKHENEYSQKRVNDIISKNPEKYKNKEISIKYSNFLQVPYIHIDEMLDYNKELADRKIKAKDYEKIGDYWKIDKTIQTIKFDLNNKGAKLKSEAAMAVTYANALYIDNIEVILNNYYYLDRPFIIFLKETNKDKPYFAARVKDGKYLVKNK